MLVLTRKHEQRIMIGENIVLTVLNISEAGHNVRIGIDAPKEITILREEVQKRLQDNTKSK